MKNGNNSAHVKFWFKQTEPSNPNPIINKDYKPMHPRDIRYNICSPYITMD